MFHKKSEKDKKKKKKYQYPVYQDFVFLFSSPINNLTTLKVYLVTLGRDHDPSVGNHGPCYNNKMMLTH